MARQGGLQAGLVRSTLWSAFCFIGARHVATSSDAVSGLSHLCMDVPAQVVALWIVSIQECFKRW